MLDTPIQIGALTLKNRLVMPPMHTGLSDAGRVTPQLETYEKARPAKYNLHSCLTYDTIIRQQN